MATPPEDYDAATALYLNPELSARFNVRTVEDLRDRYEEFAALPDRLPPLPQTFDDQVYIADNRDSLDFSAINKTIYAAMSNQGVPHAAIDANGMFLGTILREVSLIARNTFEFAGGIDELGLFRLNNKSLQVGDEVKLSRPKGTDHVYGKVVAMDPVTYRFTISNAAYDVDPPAVPVLGARSNYEFYGIRLYDFERLARVNLVRKLQANPEVQEVLTLSREFNKEFHQILYPNTRLLTQSETYIDFINRWGLKDYRLANAGDLYNASAPLTTILNLQVRCNLTLGKLVRWKGFTICNFSSNDWSTSDDSTDTTLPTDRAIKTYVDRPYRTFATYNRLLTCNDAAFTRNVFMASNVFVRLDSTDMQRDVTMRSNLTVEQNTTVFGYINCGTTTQTRQLLAISRIGIGSDGASVESDSYSGPAPPPPAGGSTIPGYIPPSTGGGSSGGGSSGGGSSGGGSTNIGTGTATTLAVQDKIVFANGAYTAQVSEFDSALRLFPSGSTGTNRYTLFDSSGNIGVGVNANVTNVDYKLFVDGNVYSTGAVITQSDARVKSELSPLCSPSNAPGACLRRLLKLQGYTWRSCNVPCQSGSCNYPSYGCENVQVCPLDEDAPGSFGIHCNATIPMLSSLGQIEGQQVESQGDVRRRHVGLLAQDALAAVPEAVYTDAHTGLHSIAYGNLMGLVVEALRDVSVRLDGLEKNLGHGSALTSPS